MAQKENIGFVSSNLSETSGFGEMISRCEIVGFSPKRDASAMILQGIFTCPVGTLNPGNGSGS